MTSVTGDVGGEEMVFTDTLGQVYKFYHSRDCCESVDITDIAGELSDLLGAPLLMAEEISSENEPAPENADSYTWTFYKFATVKGYVNVRWLGESNGYYSEEVAFYTDNPEGAGLMNA